MFRAARQEAAKAAFGGDTELRAWELQSLRCQRRVRALYAAQGQLLRLSRSAEDRRLGEDVLKFLADMPQPDSQRLALARELRAANQRLADKDGGLRKGDPSRSR